MKKDNNLDNILNELKKGKPKKDVEDYLMNQLDDKQTKKLNEIMNDDNALNNLLNTPQAQSLLKKLIGEDEDDG